MQKGITTLNVRESTKARIDQYGRYKETYDALLNRLLDIVEVSMRTAKKEEILSRCR